METIKFNDYLRPFGVSENIIRYKLSNEEKVQIKKNKEETYHNDFNSYPSQPVSITIRKKSKR